MQEEERKEIKSIEKSAKVISDIAGGVVAPIVGLIAAGPVGGIAGGVVGTLIKYGTEEFLSRYLTPKEVRRVGTSAEFIVNKINERLTEGDLPNENFFMNKEGGTSDAEEIFEGVLIKARNEYQEKKLRYISSIFVNASFDPSISADNVNQVLNIADGLTYRQLCLISLIGKNAGNKYQLRTVEKRENFHEIATEELIFIQNEARQLHRLNIINSDDRLSIGNYVDFKPSGLILMPLGNRLYQLLSLNEMPDEEYTFINELR